MSASVTPNASTRFRLILPGCDVLRDSSLHYRATVSLPSLSSRAADRAKLERDVEAFLARGGWITKVGVGESANTIKPKDEHKQLMLNAHMGQSKAIWNDDMRRILRQRYYGCNKADLAKELGVTPQHLYNEAARLGLTSRRTRKDDGK